MLQFKGPLPLLISYHVTRLLNGGSASTRYYLAPRSMVIVAARLRPASASSLSLNGSSNAFASRCNSFTVVASVLAES